jgi:hypothetical protein
MQTFRNLQIIKPTSQLRHVADFILATDDAAATFLSQPIGGIILELCIGCDPLKLQR